MDYDLSYPEAMTIIGGLSNPSKMPWYSWSTSAYDCITGSRLREVKNSVCSDCYACKGCYVFSVVRSAQARRLDALKDPRFEDAFVKVLTTLYEKSRKTYTKDGEVIKENRFRWHDSGDLQSVNHLHIINNIAKRTPMINHWCPTREYGILKKFLKKDTLAENLLVRVSAAMIQQTFKERPLGLPFSTVGALTDESLSQCPASEQGNKCLNCTNCWDKTKDVNYAQH